MSTGAVYDLMLLGHVAAGLIGFGSIAVTGYEATEVGRLAAAGLLPGDGGSGERRPERTSGRQAPTDEYTRSDTGVRIERARRYFRPGTNWAGRAIYLVPLLGICLVVIGDETADLGRPWLIAAGAMWVAAAMLAELVLWPSERRIQDCLAAGTDLTGTAGDAAGQGRATPSVRLVAAARRAGAAAGILTVTWLVAAFLMVAQPR